jgi:hypothetical protein
MGDCAEYVELAEAELKASDLAISNDVRIAHAEQAFLYAKLAVEAAGKEAGDIRSRFFRGHGSRQG